MFEVEWLKGLSSEQLDALYRGLIDYSKKAETGWHQLAYLVPRLFPEFREEFSEREGNSLIFGHCATHHGLTADEVRKMPVFEVAALLAADLKKTMSPADAGKGQAHGAHAKSTSHEVDPADRELLAAVEWVRSHRDTTNSDREALRLFFEETAKDCPQTLKMQQRIIRARGDGRISLDPRRKKRTKRTAR